MPAQVQLRPAAGQEGDRLGGRRRGQRGLRGAVRPELVAQPYVAGGVAQHQHRVAAAEAQLPHAVQDLDLVASVANPAVRQAGDVGRRDGAAVDDQ